MYENSLKLVYASAAIFCLVGCASIKPVGDSANLILSTEAPTKINWPAQYQPEKVRFYVHNEIFINAPPQKVWHILIDAGKWEKWYPGAFNVSVINSSDGLLRSDSSFSWNTMGFDFTSEIKEFQPPFRLSWESRRGLIQGYHAWLIIPTESGSRVITDEAQHGFLAHLQPIFVPNKLRDLHDVWLQKLKELAEKQ